MADFARGDRPDSERAQTARRRTGPPGPVLSRPAGRHRCRPARRSGGLGQDPAAHQGRAAANSARTVSRRVLRRTTPRCRRILAVGRRHRTAAVLSALGARHGVQHPLLPPRLRGDRGDAGRSGPRLLPARHPPGRASLRARRRRPRHRHDLVRLGQQHGIAQSARTHPTAQADDLGRHGELRHSPGEPCRSAGHRPRRVVRAQDHRCGRAALPRQAPEARAKLGRGGVRSVRHDRRRAGLRAGAARGGIAGLVRSVSVRGRRRDDRRTGAGGQSRRPRHHVARQQQRHAVSALVLGRSHQHLGSRPAATGPGRSSR